MKNKNERPQISVPSIGCSLNRTKAEIYVDLENYELFTNRDRYGFILDVYSAEKAPDTLRLKVLRYSTNKYINGAITTVLIPKKSLA